MGSLSVQQQQIIITHLLEGRLASRAPRLGVYDLFSGISEFCSNVH